MLRQVGILLNYDVVYPNGLQWRVGAHHCEPRLVKSVHRTLAMALDRLLILKTTKICNIYNAVKC